MLLTLKKWVLLVSCCCIALTLRAQTRTEHDISGFVCTKGTIVRVAQVGVTNIKNKATTSTDQLGGFTIKAAIGDTLQFVKYDFSTVYLPVTALTDMVVFLLPVVHLETVTVQGQTKQQEVNGIMDDYRKKGVYNNGKSSAMSAVASPLNGLYNLFGKDPRNARHFAEMAKNDTEAAQDLRKYNRELVKRVTGLPDDEVNKFMDAYRPSHEDLLKMNDYDVIQYIKHSLESYKQFGPPVTLPKLSGDTTKTIKKPF